MKWGSEERLGEWEAGSQLVWPETVSEHISPTLKDIEAVGLVGGRRMMDGQGV